MLKGKNAIITGTRSGIGRATVECFARNGANIWSCARAYDQAYIEDMQRVSQLYGVDIWPLFFDVTDDSQIKNAVSQIRKHKKSVDVLVNVAGIAEESTNFQMTSLEKMKRVMEANFFSATIISQYVSRLMVRQQYGTIVNITSIAGLDGEPAQYEYASSKAALIGATKNLARELAPYNIRVNAVAPGMIETKMGWAIDEKLRDHMLEKTIMRRMGTPDEVANVVAFLASNLSSYMTGQVIRIDGGV